VAQVPRWIDLLDPTPDELAGLLPSVDPDAVEILATPHLAGHTPRPLLESHGTFILAVFIDARPVPQEDRTSYREIDFMVSRDLFVTVRKTPPDGKPWEPEPIEMAAARGASSAELFQRALDDIAESFLDVVDITYEEIEELEDHIDDWPSARTRRRGANIRRDLLFARRLVTGTRSAVRRIVDGRIEPGGDPLPRDLAVLYGDTYETCVRAAEDLDVERDLLAAAREYHQSTLAETQAEVAKKLTVIASLLLTPTLIVGFYGQNFGEEFQDWYWSIGVSSSLIVATAVAQLALFKWRRWI
jgi:Mg2+ and Co2+ transporter CorA